MKDEEHNKTKMTEENENENEKKGEYIWWLI